MKKKIDAGLAYVKKLGISPERNGKVVFEKLLKCSDQEHLNKLDKALSEENLEEIYRLKNVNDEMARCFTGSYSASLIRQAVNYIDSHREYFGKEILEVGCDDGFMTCYLASTFPESHITAIDRYGYGIAIAKQQAEKFGLTNITFLQTELKDLAFSEYDTVFSMRTLQENCKEGLIYSEYQLLSEKLEGYFIPLVQDYGKLISDHVKVGGYVVTIEKCEVDPLLLGWMFSLADAASKIIFDSYEKLDCEELGEKSELHAFACMKKSEAEPEDGENIYAFWCDLFDSEPAGTFHGWMAEMLLQNYIEELIEGYYYENEAGQIMMKNGLYTVHGMPDTIMVFQSSFEMSKLDFFAADMQEKVKNDMKKLMKYMEDNKLSPRPFEYKDGVEKPVSSLILPQSAVSGKKLILPR